MSPVPADRDRPDEDLDAAFAAIIAGWDDIPSLDDRSGGPAGEQADDRTSDQAEDRPSGAAGEQPGDGPAGRFEHGRQGSAEPGLSSGAQEPASGPVPSGPRDWSPPDDEDDDRYHPPEPPPLPRGDLVGRLAWGGVLLGPAFLLFAGVLWPDAPRLWLTLAVLAFVGGFVTLVLRLPADRDDTDGDDGAVV